MVKQQASPAAKGKNIRCRYCAQKNSVREGSKAKATCGRCKLPLSSAKHRKFANLGKHEYIHPADSKALAAFRSIPGVDTALKQLIKFTGESAVRIMLLASAVKVTPKQFPDLHAKLQVACTTLGVDLPDLYVQQNPIVNAFTTGVEKHVIVLHSGLLERLNDEETLAVIAHEVGHIHAEHVLYLTAARLVEAITKGTLLIVPGSELIKFLISASVSGALLAWARRAELSCDRAALLVTQNPNVIGRTMMQLAGGTMASKIDYEEFLEQGREFKRQYDDSALDKFWADIINAGQTHPFPIWRVSEVFDWVESGEYEALMKR